MLWDRANTARDLSGALPWYIWISLFIGLSGWGVLYIHSRANLNLLVVDFNQVNLNTHLSFYPLFQDIFLVYWISTTNYPPSSAGAPSSAGSWGGLIQVQASSGEYRLHYFLFLIDHFILLTAVFQECAFNHWFLAFIDNGVILGAYSAYD